MVGFSLKDAARIARVVKRVERMSINGGTQRRRSGTSQRKPHLVGLATVICDACDLTSSLTAATMPECSADVHYANGTEWAVGQAGATIRNPTPFRFTGALCWVKQCGRTWLIDRPADWRPHAYFGTVATGGVSGSGATLYADLTQRDLGTFGYIASNSATDEIRIDCPVFERPFRVSWGGSLVLSIAGTPSVVGVRFGIAHTSSLLHWQQTGTPTTRYYEFSGSYVLTLSQNSILKLQSEVTVTGGTLSLQQINQSWVTVEPLF